MAKPTMSDVARLAGVSTATVSRVLQRSPRISAATSERVLEATRLLNYRPNVLAGALRRQRSGVVGVVVSDSANLFFTQVIRAIEDALSDSGYQVMLCNSDGDVERECRHVDLLLQRQVDGLIISVASETGRHLELLRRTEVPMVFINRRPAEVEGVTVLADGRGAMHQVVHYLAQKGHRRIGFLQTDLAVITGRERFAGFREGLAAERIDFDSRLVSPTGLDVDSAREATLAQLALPSGVRPTALVASGMYSSTGMVAAVYGSAMLVPDEVSLVGYDDHPWASYLSPPLTLVAQPTEMMGRQAAQLLISQIREGVRRTELEVPRLPCTFIERGSVADLTRRVK